MSYIEDKITIKEYLDNIQDKGKKNHIKSILNQFDIFCKQKYNKSNQQIMDVNVWTPVGSEFVMVTVSPMLTVVIRGT